MVDAGSLPASGLAGLWFFDQYSAKPRPNVPNALAASTPVSSSVWSASRRLFGNPTFWNNTNGLLTIADFAATSYDGSNNAAAITAATGAWQLLNAAGTFKAAAATYTVAVNARWRGTGRADFRIGNYFGATQLATRTARNSWGRYAFTISPGVGGGVNAGIGSPDGTSAAALEIDSLELYPGSRDLGPRTDVGHLLFGRHAFDPAPVLAGGSIDMSSRFAFIAFPAPASMGAFTVMCYGAKQAFGTGYMPMLSRAQAYSDFTALFELNDDPTLLLAGGTKQQFSGRMMSLAGFHAIGVICDGATASIMVDGVTVFSAATASLGVSAQDFLVNTMHNLGNLGRYRYSGLAYWQRALSADEWNDARGALMKHAAGAGVPVPASTRWLVTAGDSITANTGNYPSLFMPNANPAAIGVNFATTGYQIGHVAAQAGAIKAVLAQSAPGEGPRILTCLLGTNDLQFPTGSAQVDSMFLDPYAAFCESMRGAGFKVAIGTALPSTRPNVNANRAYANPIIRSWAGSRVDAVFDFAAHPTMGPDAAASNPAWYPDGVHPSPAGQAILETIYRPVVNGF
jgi:lysophospholipase L1-like esterase